MITLSHVSKDYPMGSATVHALADVSLHIEPGEFVSIIGPSGSGKSTLMNVIGCLDTPSSGTYLLAGRSVEGLHGDRLAQVRNATIGFVFQTFNLLPRLNALENVELPLVYSGLPPRERRRRAATLLDRVGLAARSRHRPAELSGGQRQRVAIARALATRPEIILADEPTGALDTTTGEEIMSLLEELNRSGTTLILVTHEPGLAARAGRTIRLLDGRITAERGAA